MLAKIQASHIGIQGCLRRTREVVYWPQMDKDVAAYVAKCDVCNSQPAEQGKEPLICHELPTRPWEKMAVDLFDLNGTEFMITVDYYSSLFEVERLASKTAKEVVKKLGFQTSWFKTMGNPSLLPSSKSSQTVMVSNM